jgi:hypothetical protein
VVWQVQDAGRTVQIRQVSSMSPEATEIALIKDLIVFIMFGDITASSQGSSG